MNPGQRTARPPVSPHANLTAIERTGTTSWGSAIWSLACTCGATLTAYAPVIKSGIAKCEECNPSATVKQLAAILAALPGDYEQIGRKAKLSRGKVRYGLELLRKDRKCFIGAYLRPSEQGSYSPVFQAGDSDDVPCKLQPIPRQKSERKYKKRIKAAIARAAAGGKEDPRYIRHISLHVAKQTAASTRAAPQSWFAALGAP